jgi:predicted secreted Zn-dependent protease
MKYVLRKPVFLVVLTSLLPLIMWTATSAPAEAATIVRKTVSYFTISGRTAIELDRQLATHGPKVAGMERHPGATQIKFSGAVTYRNTGSQCFVSKANVVVNIGIILPRWSDRRRAQPNLVFLWDTLSSDIRRHEERHAEIAVNHARTLEKRLLALGPRSTCEDLAAKVSQTTDDEIALHDADQQRFDRTESINFESRLTRLLQYRAEQARKG